MNYSNFRYCTPEGNRVAVFARPVSKKGKNTNEKTEIFILECSKHDTFSRRKAKETYNNWKMGGLAYYLSKEKGRCDDDNGTPSGCICVDQKPFRIHTCHPQIVTLSIECTQSAVNRYLKSFLKRFWPYSETSQSIQRFIKIYTGFKERSGYYVEHKGGETIHKLK